MVQLVVKEEKEGSALLCAGQDVTCCSVTLFAALAMLIKSLAAMSPAAESSALILASLFSFFFLTQ